MDVSDVANRAADRISRLGLWQGDDDGVGTCLVNSVSDSTDSYIERSHTLKAVSEYLGLTYDLQALFDWNDAPERTQAEVVEVLRAAAIIEAARGLDVRVVEPAVAS